MDAPVNDGCVDICVDAVPNEPPRHPVKRWESTGSAWWPASRYALADYGVVKTMSSDGVRSIPPDGVRSVSPPWLPSSQSSDSSAARRPHFRHSDTQLTIEALEDPMSRTPKRRLRPPEKVRRRARYLKRLICKRQCVLELPLSRKMKLCLWQLLVAIASIVLLVPKRPESGNWADFCPRESICTGDPTNLALLLVSRITGYAMYVSMLDVFVTKCSALKTFWWNTYFRHFSSLEEMHKLHKIAGWSILLCTIIHGLFHAIRWARQDKLHFLYSNVSGVTGLIACMACVAAALPMGVKFIRERICWEVRKFTHWCAGIAFGIAIILHAPETNIGYFMVVVLALYVVDYIYVQFCMTYEATASHFHRLEKGVVLYFKNPKGFEVRRGGYVLICVPFISTWEWHAFSVYQLPSDPSCSCVCMVVAGDWTKELHDQTEWHTQRPTWIQGPFVSPFTAAVNFDNLICVATGIGITPSIGAIEALGTTRCVNLIWICNDASLIEFYTTNVDFPSNAWTLIYYTGSRKFALKQDLNDSCLIISGRPVLKDAVAMILTAIEGGHKLPEEIILQSEETELTMREHWRELQGLTDNINAKHALRLVIARALQRYAQPAIHGKLEHHTAAALDRNGLMCLVADLAPDMELSNDMIAALAEEFSADDPCFADAGKLFDFCTQCLKEFHRKRVTTPGGFEATYSDTPAMSPATAYLYLQREVTNSKHTGFEGIAARFDRWVVLYCGGSVVVSNELKDLCKCLGIVYRSERFDW